MKPSRSELSFASFLTYCPRGDADAIKRSQNLMRQVKENRVIRSGAHEEATARRVARRFRERDPAFAKDFLGPDRTLVPVPRSGLRVPGALWPAHEIATALRSEGFGMHLLPCLQRSVAVMKAATARSEDRPKARAHFDSLALRDPLSLPARITLVDDVVTRGAQLFGAAWRIWSQRPDVEVRAFIVLRTISNAEDFHSIADPCTGRIEWRAEDCRRVP